MTPRTSTRASFATGSFVKKFDETNRVSDQTLYEEQRLTCIYNMRVVRQLKLNRELVPFEDLHLAWYLSHCLSQILVAFSELSQSLMLKKYGSYVISEGNGPP